MLIIERCSRDVKLSRAKGGPRLPRSMPWPICLSPQYSTLPIPAWPVAVQRRTLSLVLHFLQARSTKFAAGGHSSVGKQTSEGHARPRLWMSSCRFTDADRGNDSLAFSPPGCSSTFNREGIAMLWLRGIRAMIENIARQAGHACRAH